MRFARIVGTLKILSVYECSNCGVQELGTTSSADVDCHNPADLAFHLTGLVQRSHDMPYGWSYCGKFLCPKCTHSFPVPSADQNPSQKNQG